MSEQGNVTPDEGVQRIYRPSTRLRWKRSYDGVELSQPVLQQLFSVEVYNATTMTTKVYEEWQDVPEVGPNE